MRIIIFGVPIDSITRTEARIRAEQMMNERTAHLVTTPNPEMLVDAFDDRRFAEVLRSADLNVPDGIGLVLAARITGQKIQERIPGADFADDVCLMAAEKHKKVYLLGGLNENTAAKAAEILRHKYPELNIVGAEYGGIIYEDKGKLRIAEDVMRRINQSGADILLAGFGHRRQEVWLSDNLPDLPNIQLAIGVGGTIDFIAGAIRRAPLLVRRAGFEWLWRLTLQPWRFRRIWKAVVVFPLLVLRRGRDKINP